MVGRAPQTDVNECSGPWRYRAEPVAPRFGERKPSNTQKMDMDGPDGHELVLKRRSNRVHQLSKRSYRQSSVSISVSVSLLNL